MSAVFRSRPGYRRVKRWRSIRYGIGGPLTGYHRGMMAEWRNSIVVDPQIALTFIEPWEPLEPGETLSFDMSKNSRADR